MHGTGKILFILATAFVISAFVVLGISTLPFSGDESFGVSGCCKIRECPDESCSWYVISGDYEQCDKLNKERDGDNLEDEEGLVWWDPLC
jgi:hypothetical protein